VEDLLADPISPRIQENESEKPLFNTPHILKTHEVGERMAYENCRVLKKDKFDKIETGDHSWKINMERVLELSLGMQKEMEELKEDTDFMDPFFYNIWNRLTRRPKVHSLFYSIGSQPKIIWKISYEKTREWEEDDAHFQ